MQRSTSGHQGKHTKETGGLYPFFAEVQAHSTATSPAAERLRGEELLLGSPHRDPQSPSDSTGCSATPGMPGRTLNRGRGRGTPPVWHSGVYNATPRWSCPLSFFWRRTWTTHKSFLSVLMPRHVRQRSWPSWAPGNDHTQKRTGDKTSLKRRDHPWYF